MVTARFYFKPEYAHHFIENANDGQTVIEVAFSHPMEIVEACREFEPYLVNCTAHVDGRIIDLKTVSKS